MRHVLLAAALCSVCIAASAGGPGVVRSSVGRVFRPATEAGSIGPGLQAVEILPRSLPGGSASETWEYIFRFSSGLILTAEFRVTNLGPGSGRAQVIASSVWPGGRRPPLMLNGRPRGDWTVSTANHGFTMSVAQHTLSVDGNRSRLALRASGGAFELDAIAVAPPYRAERAFGGRDGFYDLIVFAPRMAVQGVSILPDGTRQDLGPGVGFALHSITNLADFDRAIAVLRLHTFEGPTQVSLLEFTSPRTYERVGLALTIRGAEVRGSSGVVSRSYTGLVAEAEKPRYPLPAGIEWRPGAGGVEGLAKLTLRRRDDLLAHVSSPFTRFIAGRSAHPVRYLYDAECRLTVQAGGERLESIGAGVATLEILNAPPAKNPW